MSVQLSPSVYQNDLTYMHLYIGLSVLSLQAWENSAMYQMNLLNDRGSSVRSATIGHAHRYFRWLLMMKKIMTTKEKWRLPQRTERADSDSESWYDEISVTALLFSYMYVTLRLDPSQQASLYTPWYYQELCLWDEVVGAGKDCFQPSTNSWFDGYNGPKRMCSLLSDVPPFPFSRTLRSWMIIRIPHISWLLAYPLSISTYLGWRNSHPEWNKQICSLIYENGSTVSLIGPQFKILNNQQQQPEMELKKILGRWSKS